MTVKPEERSPKGKYPTISAIMGNKIPKVDSRNRVVVMLGEVAGLNCDDTIFDGIDMLHLIDFDDAGRLTINLSGLHIRKLTDEEWDTL